MKFFCAISAIVFLLGAASALAQESQGSSVQGYTPRMGPGYGPGMMRGITPEQRQQHWEQMRQRGYGPAMAPGLAPQGPDVQ